MERSWQHGDTLAPDDEFWKENLSWENYTVFSNQNAMSNELGCRLDI